MTLQKTNNLNTNQTTRLSVQVTLYGLSFLFRFENEAPAHLITKEFEVARTPEEILLEIEKLFAEEPLLKQPIEKVTLIFGTSYYTLVPTTLFDENKISEYLKFNTKILPNDFVSFDEVENHALNVVYVPFVNMTNFFFEKFGHFHYFHCATILLKYFLDKEKYNLDPKVFLHVEREHFDCIIVKNGKPLLCNSYPYKTPEDFAYFVLFAMEQLNLNPNSVKIGLCGRVQKNDANYEILYHYVRHIYFLEDASLVPIENAENHQQFILKITS
ncbi:MAG: DUF3822 family protein [Flavobacteriaceae bacterium]